MSPKMQPPFCHPQYPSTTPFSMQGNRRLNRLATRSTAKLLCLTPYVYSQSLRLNYKLGDKGQNNLGFLLKHGETLNAWRNRMSNGTFACGKQSQTLMGMSCSASRHPELACDCDDLISKANQSHLSIAIIRSNLPSTRSCVPHPSWMHLPHT